MLDQHKRAVPQTLGDLRFEIDRIDDAMLDLVERRMTVTASIAALKNGDGANRLRLRPRREAEVVDRLTRRAQGAPPEMIGHLWRTLMSYSLESQAPMHLVLHTNGDRLAMQDSVRARFGPAARIRWAADAGEALEAARDGEAVAVVCERRGDEDLLVFDTIPCGAGVAYAIGRVAPEDVVPQEVGR